MSLAGTLVVVTMLAAADEWMSLYVIDAEVMIPVVVRNIHRLGLSLKCSQEENLSSVQREVLDKIARSSINLNLSTRQFLVANFDDDEGQELIMSLTGIEPCSWQKDGTIAFLLVIKLSYIEQAPHILELIAKAFPTVQWCFCVTRPFLAGGEASVPVPACWTGDLPDDLPNDLPDDLPDESTLPPVFEPTPIP